MAKNLQNFTILFEFATKNAEVMSCLMSLSLFCQSYRLQNFARSF